VYSPCVPFLNFKPAPSLPQKIGIKNPVKIKNPEKWDYRGIFKNPALQAA
jgi:hypothetical protein